MDGYQLWPTPVFDDVLSPEEFSEVKLNDLILLIETFKKMDPGNVFSNVGGWQSIPFWRNDHPLIDDLIDCFQKRIDAISELFETPMRVSNIWINVNGSDHSNMEHTHPVSMFSGVLYVKASSDQGNLVISKPNYIQEMHIAGSNFFPNYLKEFCAPMPVKPETRNMIFFPSHVPHIVEANKTNSDRISIAFNAFTPSFVEDELLKRSKLKQEKRATEMQDPTPDPVSESKRAADMWSFMDQ